MSSSSRTPGLTRVRRRPSGSGQGTVALFRAADPAAKNGPKLRRPITITSGTIPDFATRLRVAQRSLRNKIEGRDALVDVVRAVNTSLDPAKIAELIVDRLASWLPAPCWALVSADPSGHLSIMAEQSLEPGMGPAAHGVAGWVMQRGDEFSSADLSRDSRVDSPLTASVVGLCLTCRGRRIGAVVGLDGKTSSREPRLTPVTRRALSLLLEPASVALDNAFLLKRAEALSVTDDLTRLYNSRYLNLVLRREAKRASRSGRPLSLLFLDLDGFKSVNDTHGHLFGSRALVEAASVIRGCARETDVVARFGGDEFAVILPDTGNEGAVAVAERIRERIASHPFLARESLRIRLTASVGVATLPDVAASAEELMQAADGAMYQVKDRGKNGIQAATPPTDN